MQRCILQEQPCDAADTAVQHGSSILQPDRHSAVLCIKFGQQYWAAVLACSPWMLDVSSYAGGVTGGFAGGEAGLQQFLEEGEFKFKDPNAAGMVAKAFTTHACACIICATFAHVA